MKDTLQCFFSSKTTLKNIFQHPLPTLADTSPQRLLPSLFSLPVKSYRFELLRHLPIHAKRIFLLFMYLSCIFYHQHFNQYCLIIRLTTSYGKKRRQGILNPDVASNFIQSYSSSANAVVHSSSLSIRRNFFLSKKNRPLKPVSFICFVACPRNP